ncbi:DUF4411 family protein [Beggiatoa leptomitoformis]|uniref:DUF4411 family protein n=1 Tax=Beggiatoa leptomitoformis TaxID=288004 RepID=A0A2N9Y9X5_9GAMM|nr:DUF4411 family protein [Beggiatoa leptomitoformis]ALG67302.1 DUF4411 family protein [Beggiatoa leptomitoformis]AUI67266.1 DUF4411 family protein [Beggiatoa leptomitoformis]
MGSTSKFLLDANVFIQAKNLHYCFDFCQVFWDWIIQAHQAGIVFSIDKVKQELENGKEDDPVRQWIDDERLSKFFLADLNDTQVVNVYREIVNWISRDTHYTELAKAEFLRADIADASLIAVAMTHNYTIVTHERSDPNAKRRVLIPDAAKEFRVECVLIYDLLSKYAAHSFQLKQ